MNGGSIADLLRANVSVTARFSLRVLRGVAHALAFLHAEGIPHSNIKASNVIVNSKASVVQLTDMVLSPIGAQTCTRTNIALPVYTAPEMVTGGQASIAADIYAFGILLRQLLGNSELVYEQENASSMLSRVVEDKRRFLALPSGIPAALVELSMRCVAHDAASRPAADEVVDALSD